MLKISVISLQCSQTFTVKTMTLQFNYSYVLPAVRHIYGQSLATLRYLHFNSVDMTAPIHSSASCLNMAPGDSGVERTWVVAHIITHGQGVVRG